MIRTISVLGALCLLLPLSASANPRAGLAVSAGGTNKALLVGVSHGLMGLDLDIDMATAFAENNSYKFEVSKLWEEEGTGEKVAAALEAGSRESKNGSFFFYYTGHGSSGSLYLQDGDFTAKQIRDAIAAGRAGTSPLERLTIMVDACYSASLNPIFRKLLQFGMPAEFAAKQAQVVATKEIANALGAREKYWNSLVVIASSKEDETSMAGWDGSQFTVAATKAFQEVSASAGTVGEWFDKTVTYTEDHTPVARFVPDTVRDEKLN